VSITFQDDGLVVWAQKDASRTPEAKSTSPEQGNA